MNKIMSILNLNVDNPFDVEDNDIPESIVHIRIFQRKTRKYVTSIEGLAPDLDLKKNTKIYEQRILLQRNHQKRWE